MSPAVISVVTFLFTSVLVGVACVVADACFGRYRHETDARLSELAPRGAARTTSSLFKSFDRDSGRESWSARLDEIIEQSGLETTKKVLAGAAAGMALTLFAVGLLATRRWWLAAPIGVCGLAVVPLYVYLKRKRRMATLLSQLPRALELISRAVRAGQTVQSAFRLVADELDQPLAYEFQSCYEHQNLGMSYETSLRTLARRTGIMELQFLAVVLLVQSRCGGNLVELLSGLTQTVYRRLKFKQRVRALTSEGRMQAAVLIVLPTAAFVGMHFIAPDYVATLHRHPHVLAMTVGAQILGAAWIQQYLKYDF